MSKVVEFKTKAITVFAVVEEIKKRVNDIEEIYIVTMENGHPCVYSCGDLKGLAIAALVMNDYAQNVLHEPETYE